MCIFQIIFTLICAKIPFQIFDFVDHHLISLISVGYVNRIYNTVIICVSTVFLKISIKSSILIGDHQDQRKFLSANQITSSKRCDSPGIWWQRRKQTLADLIY